MAIVGRWVDPPCLQEAELISCMGLRRARLAAEAGARLVLLGAVAVSTSSPAAGRTSGTTCTELLGADDWYCHGEHMRVEQQHVVNASADHFNVRCIKGGRSLCSSWRSASGVLDIHAQQVTVKFDTGASQTGNLSSDCRRILWCGLPGCPSWCQKDDCGSVPPPPPPPPPPPAHNGCAAGSRPAWRGGPCCNVTCEQFSASSGSCPCGPGCEDCGAPYDVKAVPGFHLMDRSCAQNDPAAPFYDPQHDRYHVMYQKHAAAPRGTFGSGPVWGHMVSQDMLRWRQLPVALWNGPSSWDHKAIFTGSATMVDGLPVLIYPGLDGNSTADSHINLCRATPLNRSDPDLVQWSKAAGPVAATGGDGPSAAWSTGTRERRMIVGAGRKPMVYLLRATY